MANIYTYPLHFIKIHSFSEINPKERSLESPSPPALILFCHGIALPGTPEIAVPLGPPEVRFAAAHGEEVRIDIKWHSDLVDYGLESALRYDFKHRETTVTNYYLGKAEPDAKRGLVPKAWFAYTKADIGTGHPDPKKDVIDSLQTDYDKNNPQTKYPSRYNPEGIAANKVVSSSYVGNMIRYKEISNKDGSKKKDFFDYATVKKNCDNLRQVFSDIQGEKPRYKYLLCAFCREVVKENGDTYVEGCSAGRPTTLSAI